MAYIPHCPAWGAVVGTASARGLTQRRAASGGPTRRGRPSGQEGSRILVGRFLAVEDVVVARAVGLCGVSILVRSAKATQLRRTFETATVVLHQVLVHRVVRRVRALRVMLHDPN